MKALLIGRIVGSVLFIGLAASPAHPDDDVDPSIWNQHFQVEASQETPSTTDDGPTSLASSTPWDYRLVEKRCSNSDGYTFCMVHACGDPDEVGYLVERRLKARPEDGWQPYSEACIAPERPIVTPGLVLEEVRRIGLPAMSIEAPPETFVNYDTVVYTEAETFSRTVNLLGFTVDLEATPSQFHWNYGDGNTETTSTAGRPYPATDVTHTWSDAHRTFHPSVDVTYKIRFRVDGGDWQSLGETLTIAGPDGDVRIREATGMLADMR